MFSKNKYYKWYKALIERAKIRNNILVFEKHHIIPKSLGGDDGKTNICKLTPREHFLCHLLLTKITSGEDRKKMVYAFWGMTHRNEVKLNSRLYETLKGDFAKINTQPNVEKFGATKAAEISEKISKTSTGRVFSIESKQKMSDAHKGKPVWNLGLTKENNQSLKKLAESLTGKTRSYESIEKQRNSIIGIKRKPHREESKQKSAESNKNRPYLTCPHCGKKAQQGNFTRWHGTNCKNFKPI